MEFTPELIKGFQPAGTISRRSHADYEIITSYVPLISYKLNTMGNESSNLLFLQNTVSQLFKEAQFKCVNYC